MSISNILIRFFDIIFSSFFLLFLFPIFILISIILFFTGENEIFYLQTRISKNKKTFKLIKFATMLKNSPNIGTGTITVGNDPRILPFGKYLRNTKLNELPQLINIFLGDMSFVGPRPMTISNFKLFSKPQQDKLSTIKPGLTGIASIFFVDEENILLKKTNPIMFYKKKIIPYKCVLDFYYINHRTIWNYFKCIVCTAFVIAFRNKDYLFIFFKNIPIRKF